MQPESPPLESALQLFEAAMLVPEGPVRQSFLSAACGGDRTLLQEVQELLDVDPEADGLIVNRAARNAKEVDKVGLFDAQFVKANEKKDECLPESGDYPQSQVIEKLAATIDSTPVRLSSPVDLPKNIGLYKILEPIGEGGFGIVYMAQQTAPVRRRVALKVIKPGMDSKEVIARFEAERQALAMMDHPHVAKVFDVGTTNNGRPYFVMELVHGTKITEYCDNQRLTTEQRLKLFVDVCRAVQHAHMKGIIHRDLKPSNILITMDDDRPIPKVIDFGVSKSISQSLTDQTMFTRYGQMVGTPLYMSPEQAQFTSHDIDVRSDVYSLGVVLYELLTGDTPFNRDELIRSGFDDVQRILREVEPPRPSARVSTLRADLISTVSDKRQVDPRKLISSLAGELDWIVMKALEKDRSRRYESARELAADIQRYLDDDAVTARPQSTGYRLGKFARRHRVILTTASLVVLALVAGASVAVWQAVVATQERNRTAEQRDRAVEAEKVAAAVNEFLNEDLLAQANPENQPDPDVKLSTVIDQAAEKFENRFQDQPLVEAAIRHTLAVSYSTLGELRRARTMAERAAELRAEELGEDDESTLDSGLLIAKILSRQGDFVASEKQSRTVANLAASALGQQHPLTLDARRNLGGDLRALARYEEAQEILSEVLHLATESLGDDHELTLQTLGSFASLYEAEGRYDEAVTITRKVIEGRRSLLGNEHPHTLNAVASLGIILNRQGKNAEAKRILQECLDIRRRVFGKTHQEVAATEINLAVVLKEEGNFNEAKAISEKAVAKLIEDRGEQHPATLAAKNNLAILLMDGGNHEKALELLTEVVNVRRQKLGNQHPNTLMALMNLGAVHFSQRQYSEVEKILDEVVPIIRRVLGKEHPRTLSAIYNLAAIYTVTYQLDEAEPLCRAALKGRTKHLGAAHPKTLQALDLLSMIYIRQGRLDEAEKVVEPLVVTCTESLGSEHPQTLSARNNLASLYSKTGRLPKAEVIIRKNFEVVLSKLGPTHPQTLSCRYKLGVILSHQSRFEEAERVYLDLIEQGVDAFEEAQGSVMYARIQLAKDYRKRGLVEAWQETSRKNLEIQRRVYGEDHSQTKSSQTSLRAALMQQSQSLVESQQFQAAFEVLSQLATLSPNREQAESLVSLQVYLDDKDDTPTFSQQLWKLAQAETGDEFQKARWVVDALLSPHHGLDTTQVIEFMRPVDSAKNGHFIKLGLGLALYRQDAFKEAAETIATSNYGTPWIRPLACYFSAMAHHQVGETERARELFDVAVVRKNQVAPTPTMGKELNDWEPPRWGLWCLYQGVHREAIETLGLTELSDDGSRVLADGETPTFPALIERAMFAAETEDWETAREALDLVARSDTITIESADLLPLADYLGNTDLAGALSRWYFDGVPNQTDVSIQARWLMFAAMPPSSDLDWEPAIEAGEAIVANSDWTALYIALAASHYRAGNIEQARKVLDQVELGEVTWLGPPLNFFQAMTLHRLGEATEARSAFDAAVAGMNALTPTPTSGEPLGTAQPHRWQMWCLYRGLKREATEVLEIKSEQTTQPAAAAQ